jgi:hypothetical protein
MKHPQGFRKSWRGCALLWSLAPLLLSGCAHRFPVGQPPPRPRQLLSQDLQQEPPPPGTFLRALECLSQQAQTSAPRFELCLLDVSN